MGLKAGPAQLRLCLAGSSSPPKDGGSPTPPGSLLQSCPPLGAPQPPAPVPAAPCPAPLPGPSCGLLPLEREALTEPGRAVSRAGEQAVAAAGARARVCEGRGGEGGQRRAAAAH